MGSPRLWSFVRLESKVQQGKSGILKYAKEAAVHLERSRETTIWLHLTINDDYHEYTREANNLPAATAKLRALIPPYLKHCHWLDLHEKYTSSPYSFMPLEGEFPELRHLRYTSLRSRESLFGATFHAPLLRTILVDVKTLDAVSGTPRTPASTVAAKSLSHTLLDVRMTEEVLQMPLLSFYNHSNLRFLRIDGKRAEDWNTGASLHFHFPSLEALSLLVAGPSGNAASIDSISAPNLSTLQLRTTSLRADSVLPSFCAKSRFPKLATLQLSRPSSLQGEIEAFILAHPSLEELAFAGVGPGVSSWLSHVCEHMKPAADENATSSLPHLHSIYYSSMRGFIEDKDVFYLLVNLLKSREELEMFWIQEESVEGYLDFEDEWNDTWELETEWNTAIEPIASRWHEEFGSESIDLVDHLFRLS